MNVTAFDIYLIGVMDKIIKPILGIGGVSLGVGFFCLVACLINELTCCERPMNEEDKGTIHKLASWAKRMLTIGATLLVNGSLAPSTKLLAAMYVVPAIANSEITGKDLPEACKAIVKATTEWVEQQALPQNKEEK